MVISSLEAVTVSLASPVTSAEPVNSAVTEPPPTPVP